MDEDKLDDLTREALENRFEGWELVEFLDIPVEVVIAAFEDTIVENIEDLRDFVGIKDNNNDDED